MSYLFGEALAASSQEFLLSVHCFLMFATLKFMTVYAIMHEHLSLRFNEISVLRSGDVKPSCHTFRFQLVCQSKPDLVNEPFDENILKYILQYFPLPFRARGIVTFIIFNLIYILFVIKNEDLCLCARVYTHMMVSDGGSIIE